MKDRLMTSIVLYGSIGIQKKELWEAYQYFLKLNEELGYTSTHLGIIGDQFKSGKLTPITRTEAKFKKACDNEENIETISIYALPQDFSQAAFDYRSFVSINKSFNNQFIVITVPSEDFSKINKTKIINDSGDFIKLEKYEVFELSVLESPLIYCSKVNQTSDFTSLKIIEKIEF
ncbi:hypothetical protein [Saccharibacillus kuerlensis]|uniref:Uncharacterized protein n=1 Tax=Saccharibacillus kuerlensis TaxID=459527 RepID=A0ABQ2L296_9BACL|nr:hypothetical protein [Saccharibacillus kuerlensis]GGO00201.1 hypothetical protein GCM10010969_21110 [Saccharibacillus kuerlensis]